MDFAKARFNMVEQQIRPWDVLDFDLLDALSEIPRERFVQTQHQNIAYADEKLPLANGGKMLEPRVLAKMIQALELTKQTKVLEVGTGSGYGTAILSLLSQQVLTVDIDQTQQNTARDALNSCELSNISYAICDGLHGVSEQAPYDAIIIGGAIPAISNSLKEQLTDGGKLIAIINNTFPMKAVLIVRSGNSFNETTLFETDAPLLVSKQANAAFEF